MATTHAPGTGAAPDRDKHARLAVVITASALALAAVAVPLALRDLGDKGAQGSAATHPTPAAPSAPVHRVHGVKAGVGSRGELPALLPAARTRLDGARVRLGDVTEGVLRRAPDRTWQVWVRWNGRLQRVPTRGPARLGLSPAGQRSASWVSGEGLLYTRVVTGRSHRFRVYAWDPRGGTAYTPPALVATDLGRVCFNASFTAFGDCRAG